jgi:hypothetical protein
MSLRAIAAEMAKAGALSRASPKDPGKPYTAQGVKLLLKRK